VVRTIGVGWPESRAVRARLFPIQRLRRQRGRVPAEALGPLPSLTDGHAQGREYTPFMTSHPEQGYALVTCEEAVFRPEGVGNANEA